MALVWRHLLKKVLIISYYFMDKSVIGSVRSSGLARFLPSFGWDPVILTVRPKEAPASEPKDINIDPSSNLKIADTPLEDDPFIRWKKRFGLKADETVKQQLNLGHNGNKNVSNTFSEGLLNFCGEMLVFPDEKIGWYRQALERGRELLSEDEFDAIISTSSPVTSHLVARSLKDEYGLAWVADMRDLWSQSYLPRTFITKTRHRRLELKTLSAADSLTTVSQPLADKLKELHKSKRVYAILNGFDPDQMNPGAKLTDGFKIAYTGAIYKGKQDPEPLFRALRELRSEAAIDLNDVSADFYGDNMGWLEDEVERFDLKGAVKIHGQISRDLSIEMQRESQMLLLLNWNDPGEMGVYTGKIFDYLSAQRPILSIGAFPGVVGELLQETRSGWHASSVDEIKLLVKRAYDEFKSNGRTSYHGSLAEIDRYSHREMAKNFAQVLSTLKA